MMNDEFVIHHSSFIIHHYHYRPMRPPSALQAALTIAVAVQLPAPFGEVIVKIREPSVPVPL
jgi:hypothetical protein